MALLDHYRQDCSPDVTADSSRGSHAVERTIPMQHVHLPKLANLGPFQWDTESYEVEKGPRFDGIGPLFEALDSHRDELLDGLS